MCNLLRWFARLSDVVAIMVGYAFIVAVWFVALTTRDLVVLLVGLVFMAICYMAIGGAYQNLLRREVEVVERNSDAANRCLTIVIPGYNGVGPQLLDVLGPKLRQACALLSFRPMYGGYDQEHLVKALYERIRATPTKRLVVYAESMGALAVIEMLQRYPGLYIDTLVLNAGISSSTDVRQPLWRLRLARLLSGGPITTWALRRAQRTAVANSPSLSPDANPEAARAAEHATLKVTAPMALSQLATMGRAKAPANGTLAGRIGRVVYLYGQDDPLVWAPVAGSWWQTMVGDTPFKARVVREWEGLHCPPERPGPVIAALAEAGMR